MDSRIQQMHSDIIAATQAPGRSLAEIAKEIDSMLQEAISRVSEEITRLTQEIAAEHQAHQSVYTHLLGKLEAAKNYEMQEQSKIYDEIGNARQQLHRLERQFDWLKIDYRSQLKDHASWLQNVTHTQSQIAAIQIQIAQKIKDPALLIDEFDLKHMAQSLLESLQGLKFKQAELEEKIHAHSQPEYRYELQAQYQQLGEDITLKEQHYRSIEHVLDKRAHNKEEMALISQAIAAHVDYTATEAYRSKQASIAELTNSLQELKAELPTHSQPKPESAPRRGSEASAPGGIASLFSSASASTLHSEAEGIHSARSTP
jgi:hypothetical protein